MDPSEFRGYLDTVTSTLLRMPLDRERREESKRSAEYIPPHDVMVGLDDYSHTLRLD